MLTRRPAPRPFDVIALEVLLTLASAVLVGMLLWLAVGAWITPAATNAPVIGVLVVVALAVGAGWFLWLTGVSGWLLAGTSGVAGVQVAFLLVLGAAGQAAGVGAPTLIVMLACAAVGCLCGVFLPSPSSRRYRPAPRVRASAGGEPSAPRISPQVALVADRYGKPAVAGVVAGAAAVTAAGARRGSRSGPASDPPVEAEPVSVVRPVSGGAIPVTGPQAQVPEPPTQPAGTGPAAGRPTPAQTPAPTPPSATGQAAGAANGSGSSPDRVTPVTGKAAPPASPKGTPQAMTPAPGTGTPAAGTGPRPRQDPGAIARSGQASIDAELATPPRPGGARPPGSGTPGFLLVDPPPPMRRIKPPSSDGPRLSAVDRPPPPRPPGGPVARAGDLPQVADPGGVAPTVRSLSPDGGSLPPVAPGTALPPASPTDETLPDPAPDTTGADR